VRFGTATLVRIISSLWVIALLSDCPSCRRLDTVEISGRATDWATGAYLMGVRVTVLTDRGSMHAMTDFSGAYRLSGIPAGYCTILVEMAGYAAESTRVELESHLLFERDFLLRRNRPSGTGVSGIVYEKDSGKAVPYATVRLPKPDMEMYADSLGYFEFLGLNPGLYTIHAEKSGYESCLADAEVYKDRVTISNLGTHKIAQGVSGTVRDLSNGSGIPGAELSVLDLRRVYYTSDDGYFQAYLPPGLQRIWVFKEGYAKLETSFVAVAYQDFARMDLELRPIGFGRGTIYGKIVDEATESGLERARVSIAELGISTATDMSGWYEMSEILPGACRVSAERGGYHPYESDEVRIGKGEYVSLNVELRKREGKLRRPTPVVPMGDYGAVVGVVLDDSTCLPVQSATVVIEGTGLRNTTFSSGQFSMNRVPVGTLTIDVTAPGYIALKGKSVGVSKGAGTRVDIRLKRDPRSRRWRQRYNARP